MIYSRERPRAAEPAHTVPATLTQAQHQEAMNALALRLQSEQAGSPALRERIAELEAQNTALRERIAELEQAETEQKPRKRG